MFVEHKEAVEITEITERQPWQAALLRAADLIEWHGLAKGTTQDHLGRMCILGALMEDSIDGFGEAWRRLQSNLRMSDPCIWNNQPERTKEEVVSKLRAVALEHSCPLTEGDLAAQRQIHDAWVKQPR